MKLAYFIAVHKYAEQVAGLLDAIHDRSNVYLLHADRKSPPAFRQRISELAAGRENVFVLDDMEVIWGGWSQCLVELSAITYLCRQGLDWDYYINLSGQDFPIKPLDRVHEFLTMNRGKNFVDVRRVDTLGPRLRRIVRRRQRWLCVEIAGRARRLPVPVGPFRGSPVEYYGSSWHFLTREFCEWMISDGACEEAESLLRFTRSPDEALFQHLIMNSPFRDALHADNKRYCRFRPNSPHPIVLTMSHYDQLMRSDALFARKFDLLVDHNVVAKISRQIGMATGMRTAVGTVKPNRLRLGRPAAG